MANSSNGNEKIFCIGMPKTGTTTINSELNKAGIKATHFPMRLVELKKGMLNFNPQDTKNYDAASDLPVCASIEDIYKQWPNARYILTTRSKESWLDSCRRHPWPMEFFYASGIISLQRRMGNGFPVIKWTRNFVHKFDSLHKKVLGASIFNPQRFSQAYDVYHRRVRNLFHGNPRYLEINIVEDKPDKKILGHFLQRNLHGPFEKKDCFYTHFFKWLIALYGWDKIRLLRAQYGCA